MANIPSYMRIQDDPVVVKPRKSAKAVLIAIVVLSGSIGVAMALLAFSVH